MQELGPLGAINSPKREAVVTHATTSELSNSNLAPTNQLTDSVNTKISKLLLLAALSAGMAFNAGATSLSISDANPYFVGFITPDGGSPDDEADHINHLLTLSNDSGNAGLNDDGSLDGTIVTGNPNSNWTGWNFDDLVGTDYYDRSSNVFASPPAAVAGSKNDNSQRSFVLDGTTTYILGKYDNDNSGAAVWYVSGLIGEVILPAKFGLAGNNGLSHTSFLGSGPVVPGPGPGVPDGGTTVLLLGLGLLGLGGSKRLLRR